MNEKEESLLGIDCGIVDLRLPINFIIFIIYHKVIKMYKYLSDYERSSYFWCYPLYSIHFFNFFMYIHLFIYFILLLLLCVHWIFIIYSSAWLYIHNSSNEIVFSGHFIMISFYQLWGLLFQIESILCWINIHKVLNFTINWLTFLVLPFFGFKHTKYWYNNIRNIIIFRILQIQYC